MSAEIPDQLRSGALHGTTRLDVASAGLTTLPPEILTLADTLEILNLSHNCLKDLPDWLPELKRLRILFCSNNPFDHVPEVLGRCPALEMVGFKSCRISSLSAAALPPALRWLILTDNLLAELPPELGRRPRLQKLMLSGNRLTALPPELAGCHRLELLRLAANCFASFPDWLWNLPSLAWLAVAGNPGTEVPATNASPAFSGIPWEHLEIGPQLGEGASGLIHRAVWQETPGPGTREVAVKLFKGTMTSDGLPASEMAVCLAAGGHPQLIGALGKITGHPDLTEGLVMPLLDPDYRPLAGPPSMDSCTRDVYAPDGHFSASHALRLITDITKAAVHLHSLQLLHGDLYAHNVLHSPGGGALLSDFGAASSYPPGPADRIERLEVRALGILMQEILDRCAERAALPASLLALPALCLQADVSARPGFPGIWEILQRGGK